jgi:AraC-like DNA-binding protein
LILFILKPSVGTESFANALLSVWVLLFAWNQIYLKVIKNNILSNPISIDKYSKSLLSLDQVNIYGKQIEVFFQNKENTTNPELNLELLSNHLQLSLNLTSQVINRYFSKTLLELIRMNRIALAIHLLENTDFSILRIGLEVGYNSKSSFLRAFREEKGTTPSLYKKSLHI